MKKKFFIFFLLLFPTAIFSQTKIYELGFRVSETVTSDIVVSMDKIRFRNNIGGGQQFYLMNNIVDYKIRLLDDDFFLYGGSGVSFRYWKSNSLSSHVGYSNAFLSEVGFELVYLFPFFIAIDANYSYDFQKYESDFYISATLKMRLYTQINNIEFTDY